MVAPGGMHGCSRGVGEGGLGGVVAPGRGHAWLLPGRGVHGCSRGTCMVAARGHAWLLLGGVHGCSGGACMVAAGGMHGCSRGACMVALGGHAWLLRGACMCGWDMMRYGGQYTSYWNAFLFATFFASTSCILLKLT